MANTERPWSTDAESALGISSNSTGVEIKPEEATPAPKRRKYFLRRPRGPGLHRTPTASEEISRLANRLELFPDPIFGKKQAYGSARFGPIRAFFIRFFTLINAGTVREAHWNINCWTDIEVMAWKSSYVSNCQAIAVAVSRT
jgi:hypothetical protein